MGGGMILFATIFPTLLWADWTVPLTWYVIAVTVGYGLIGFLDDYMKVSKRNAKGVSGKSRIIAEIILAALISGIHLSMFPNAGDVVFPLFKDWIVHLGWIWVAFAAFVIVGSSNAVNLTDGLDGLAIGPVMTTASTFAILAYVAGNAKIADYLLVPYVFGAGELTIFCASLVGAGLGFLWYNTYPAQVFMGDVGSLPLGGALGTVAVLIKQELVLAIVGGVFVIEALSVITQVISFKLTGRRVFRMAPIHHHFELKGWPEPKVIVRFWIISIVLSILGLLTLKLR